MKTVNLQSISVFLLLFPGVHKDHGIFSLNIKKIKIFSSFPPEQPNIDYESLRSRMTTQISHIDFIHCQ